MPYARIVLTGPYQETHRADRSISGRLADRKAFHYDRLVAQLEAIRTRRSIKTVLIECREDFMPRFSAAAEAICRDLAALRAAGKELHFCAPRYSEATLHIASACNHRYIAPLGTVSCLGFGRTFLFFARLLERKGFRAEVFKRGAYKSAGDALTNDRIDPAVRRQYQEFFDVQQRQLNNALREGYGVPSEAIEQLINGRILQDDEAVSQGWMTAVSSCDDLADRWKREKNKPRQVRSSRNGYGRGRQVAILVIDGPLLEGDSRRDPLMGNAVGARSIVRQIRSLDRKKSCAAVVLRINSPGGSAAASESIRHELAKLAETKPLVASMSTVAASGGYWIATAARRIFAERTTLTGSIGVVSLVLSASKFFQRLGVGHRAVQTGRFTDMGSPFRALSVDERDLLDRQIEIIYRRFLELVAAARNITVEHAHLVAQGRIWDGAEAVEQKLVDVIGGLEDAVRYASTEARLRKAALRFYPEPRTGLLDRIIAGRSAGAVGWPTSFEPWPATAPQVFGALESVCRNPLAILPEALYSTLQSVVSSI